jgi:hypothetical protein
LRNVEHRIELVARVAYIFRLLFAIANEHFPTLPLPQKDSCRLIRIRPGFISKSLDANACELAWGVGAGKTKDELLDLYARLPNGPPELVRGKFHEASQKVQDDGTTVHTLAWLQLSPVGFQRPPESAEELVEAVQCVITGLEWLHTKAKMVHRDVRWPNVLRSAGHGTPWILIDFEFGACLRAGNVGADWPDQLAEQLQPKPRPKDSRWFPEHDMWQVAHLLVREMPAQFWTQELVAQFPLAVRPFLL